MCGTPKDAGKALTAAAMAPVGVAAGLLSGLVGKGLPGGSIPDATIPPPPAAATPPTVADTAVREAGERERKRALLAAAGGTILTGPRGLMTPVPGTRKTLLGQ